MCTTRRHLLAKGDCELCFFFASVSPKWLQRSNPEAVMSSQGTQAGEQGLHIRVTTGWAKRQSLLFFFLPLGPVGRLVGCRRMGFTLVMRLLGSGCSCRVEIDILPRPWPLQRCLRVFCSRDGREGGREREREKKKQVLMKTFIKVSSSLRTGRAGTEVIKEMREEDREQRNRQHDNMIKIKEACT